MSSEVAKKEQLATARATASQIRQGIHNYLHTLALIAKAYEQRHWKVLGYDSWLAYVDEEFGEQRLRLPAEHRRKAVEELRLAGMSQRAIAGTLGVNRETVMKDAREVAGNQPPQVLGTDGKTYAASRPDHPASSRGEEAAGQPDAPGLPGPGVREARTGSEDRVRAADSSVEASGDDSTDGAERRNSVQEGSDAAGAPADFPDAGAPDPETAAGVSALFPPADGADLRPAAHAAPAPAPADLSTAGAGVNPSDLVNKVLDALVPDSNPHREWQRHFFSDIHALYRVTRNEPEVVAEKADSQCIEELGRALDLLVDYRTRVLAALKASLPDNVRQMRRIS